MRRLKLLGEPGQTIVEFAFVILIFIPITFGIFDLGRGVFAYNMMSNATREAARYGVIKDRTADQVCAMAIRSTALGGVDYSNLKCRSFSGDDMSAQSSVEVLTPPSGSTQPYQIRHVTLTYRFRPISLVMATFIGGEIVTLTATSSMYIEQ